MKRDFDKEAKAWDQNEDRVKMAAAVAAAMMEELHLSRNDVVLDFGAGTGLIALRLLPRVKKVVAVDTSNGMLDVLKGKLTDNKITNVETLRWDIEEDGAKLPRVDVIVSAMTLHHIRDASNIANAFYKALSPGGRIAVADLDPDGGEFHHDTTGVEHNGFDRDYVIKIFQGAGFHSLKAKDAYRMKKHAGDGKEREFSIFLITGEKS